MKQYCRYCAFCIDGDCLYCTAHEKVLTESAARHENHCADFALSCLGDVETGKPYRPQKWRETRTQTDELQQLKFFGL